MVKRKSITKHKYQDIKKQYNMAYINTKGIFFRPPKKNNEVRKILKGQAIKENE